MANTNNDIIVTIEKNEKLGLDATELLEFAKQIKQNNVSSVEINDVIAAKLLQLIQKNNEGKCINEGYALKNSTNLVHQSYAWFPSESLDAHINFYCTYTIKICMAIEQSIINVKITHKNVIGMTADYLLENDNSPFLILIPITIMNERMSNCDDAESDQMQYIYDNLEIGQYVNIIIL